MVFVVLFIVCAQLLACARKIGANTAINYVATEDQKTPGGKLGSSTPTKETIANENANLTVTSTKKTKESNDPKLDKERDSLKRGNKTDLKLSIPSKYIPAHKAVFKITMGNNIIGTAFSYKIYVNDKEYRFLLSANHTFAGRGTKKVYLVNDYLKKTIEINKIHVLDAQEDICLMFPSDYKDLEDVVFLEPTENLLNYSELYSLNYSSFEPDISNIMMLSKGYILSRKSNNNYQIFLPLLNKGGSGAPVIIDEDNKVVGMVLNKILTNKFEYTGVANVLSAEEIFTLLSSYIGANTSLDAK